MCQYYFSILWMGTRLQLAPCTEGIFGS